MGEAGAVFCVVVSARGGGPRLSRDALRRWPKAELAASARWMIDHMRSEDAPAFIQLDSDSLATDAQAPEAPKTATPKPKKGSASDKP